MNYLASLFPDYGPPPLSQEELYSIEDVEALSETPQHLTMEEKKICGLSRQCMQFNMEHHRGCMGGTRSSCTCVHHVENRGG